MKKNVFKVAVLVAVCALALGSEAFAGNGGGKGMQSAFGTQPQLKVRQQLKTGDCDLTGVSQGVAQGSMRKPGLADGSGLAPRPQDGTGFGSPAK